MGSPGEPAWEMVYVSFQGKKTDDQVKKKQSQFGKLVDGDI